MTSWQKEGKYIVLLGCQSCKARCVNQPLKTTVLNGTSNICPLLKIGFFTRHAWTFLDVQCFRYLFLIMRAKTEQSHLTGDNYKP